MQHLRRPDPVDDPQPGGVVHRVPDRRGQRLAGRDGAAQSGQPVGLPGGEDRPVRRGCGEQHRDPVLGDGIGQLPAGSRGRAARCWPRPAAGTRRGRPSPKVNPIGGVPVTTSSGSELHDVGAEGVGDGEDVAVEVHGRLRPARGARGEGEQRDVLRGRVDRSDVRVRVRAAPGQLRRPRVGDLGHAGQLAGDVVVRERERGPGQVDDRDELGGPQHRHRRHGDAAGQQHAEPAGHQPRLVRSAQQHAVAGSEAEVAGQHRGDLVGTQAQITVGPGLAGAAHARPVVGDAVEEGGGGVEPLGVPELGEVEQQLRPLVPGWQVVAAERVGVRAAGLEHGRTSRDRVCRGGRRSVRPFSQSGRTAAPCSSTSASASQRRVTPTPALAGYSRPTRRCQTAPISRAWAR